MYINGHYYHDDIINESYIPTEGGQVKVNKINTLANIARNYGITESGNLRDDIVSEYTDILESLDTVEESVINRDISLLPIYNINEGLFKKNTSRKENIKTIDPQIEPKEALNKTKILFNKNISKYKTLKNIKLNFKLNGNDHYNQFINGSEDYLDIASFNMEKIVGKYTDNNEDEFWEANTKINNLIDDINKDLSKYGYQITVSADSEVFGDFGFTIETGAKIKELEKIKEGYIIDLDSLKFVIESKEIDINEAIQEIRDINYIGDTIPMYCVLPKDINERMSLESFIDLNNILNESNITPVCVKEYSEIEFITEAMTEEKLEKKIVQSEKNRDALVQKKKEFQKMSKEEQIKFCVGKSLKNIIVASLISIPTAGFGSIVYTTYQEMHGDNPILGPKMYINNLNIWIAAYNTDINNFKKKLKELKKGN